MKKIIPQATINRLPLYLRTLKQVAQLGQNIISSNELGRLLELTPEQIRKDLIFFGQFGMKGLGYEIDKLTAHIEKILGLQHHWRLAIIGMNDLGKALAGYPDFLEMGFYIGALFDTDKSIVGTEFNGFKIYDFNKIKTIAPRKLLDIAVITVPAEEAQRAADRVIDAGLKGIWNFAPIKLEVPTGISLVEEDLTFGLSTLSYRLAQRAK